MLCGQAPGATLAMPTVSSSVNQLCCLAPPRLAQGGVFVKGYFSRSHYMQYAPKNRVAAPDAHGAAPAQIANDSLGFSAPERSKRKHTSLGHFLCIRLPQKKQVFQASPAQRWPSNSAGFRDVSYALILLLSTHGRDFLSQTVETTVPRLVQLRQKKAKVPRAPNCRARGSEKARNVRDHQP